MTKGRKHPIGATVYKDRRGEWRWRVVARNGKIVGASSEGYNRQGDCWRNLHAVQGAIGALLRARGSIS